MNLDQEPSALVQFALCILAGLLAAAILATGDAALAERLKAHVLKTCLGHTNVGSNPTPSAGFSIDDFGFQIDTKS